MNNKLNLFDTQHYRIVVYARSKFYVTSGTTRDVLLHFLGNNLSSPRQGLYAVFLLNENDYLEITKNNQNKTYDPESFNYKSVYKFIAPSYKNKLKKMRSR